MIKVFIQWYAFVNTLDTVFARRRDKDASTRLDIYPVRRIMITAGYLRWGEEKNKEWGRDLKDITEGAEECRWCRFLWHGPHETNVTISPQQHWGYDLIPSREGTWTHENIIPRMAALCVCVFFHFRDWRGRLGWDLTIFTTSVIIQCTHSNTVAHPMVHRTTKHLLPSSEWVKLFNDVMAEIHPVGNSTLAHTMRS